MMMSNVSTSLLVNRREKERNFFILMKVGFMGFSERGCVNDRVTQPRSKTGEILQLLFDFDFGEGLEDVAFLDVVEVGE